MTGLETPDVVVHQITHKILITAHMTQTVTADGITVQTITVDQRKIQRKMNIARELTIPVSFVFHMILSIVCLQEVMPKLRNFKINLGPT